MDQSKWQGLVLQLMNKLTEEKDELTLLHLTCINATIQLAVAIHPVPDD